MPRRGNHDPREDARLAAELWKTLVTARRLSWGAGQPSWTAGEGETRPDSPGGSAELTDVHIEILTGRQPQTDFHGRKPWWWPYAILHGLDGIGLAALSAADLPPPTLIREITEPLVSPGTVLTDEDLWTICQYLGTRQNLDLRERIKAGRGLTKVLREPLERAIRHPDLFRSGCATTLRPGR